MTTLADTFSTTFREEHRLVRDGLLELLDAFENRDQAKARRVLHEIAVLTGPHFRYEEEALYPGLVRFFGESYVEKLYADHDGAIRGAAELVEIAGKESWSARDVERGQALVRGILPHVSDCDGLSILVERLPDSFIQSIFRVREQSLAAGLDLITWAKGGRQRAAFAETHQARAALVK